MGLNALCAASEDADLMHFLGLAGEHRNAIHRHLFDDIVLTHSDSGKSNARSLIDGSSYLAVLLTCRTTHNEARSIFEKEYLPRVVFKYGDLQDFLKQAREPTQSRLKRSEARFELLTPPELSTAIVLAVLAMKLLVGEAYSPTLIPEEARERAVSSGVLPLAGPRLATVEEDFEGGVSWSAKTQDGRVEEAIKFPRVSTTHPQLTLYQERWVEDGAGPAGYGMAEAYGGGETCAKIEGRFATSSGRETTFLPTLQ